MFVIPYVFEVKESIYVSFTEVTLCSSDLENPGQLMVSQVLKGADEWVAWIFVISVISYVFKVKETMLLVDSQSYHVRVTSKIQVNFYFCRCSRILIIVSYGFWY